MENTFISYLNFKNGVQEWHLKHNVGVTIGEKLYLHLLFSGPSYHSVYKNMKVKVTCGQVW